MIWLFVAICLTSLFETNSFPQVNPCVALKLPLCRIKSDFAQEHGIQVRITENLQPNNDTDDLSKIDGIQVRSLNFSALIGAGILHTKLWISDE